jgi:hypothetical protein
VKNQHPTLPRQSAARANRKAGRRLTIHRISVGLPKCSPNRRIFRSGAGPSWAGESESTGRREDGKFCRQGSENAFLLLEDQNQKHFLGSKQDKQTGAKTKPEARISGRGHQLK